MSRADAQQYASFFADGGGGESLGGLEDDRPDAAKYSFFGAPTDAALEGELGGELEEEGGLGGDAQEEELDIELEREDEDLSFAAVFAKQTRLGGASGSGAGPLGAPVAPPARALPMPPPAGAMRPPSAALLQARSGPVPPPAPPPPPPGFYGRAPQPPVQAVQQQGRWPQQQAPQQARAPPPGFAAAPPQPQQPQQPQGVPPAMRGLPMTVEQLEARLAAQAHAQPPAAAPAAPLPMAALLARGPGALPPGQVRVLPRPAGGPPAAVSQQQQQQAALPSSAPLGTERALQPWGGGSGAVESDALEPRGGAPMPAAAPPLRVLGGPSASAPPPQQQPYQPRPQPPPQQQQHGRRHYSSKYMSPEQIDLILRIQWAATHPSDVPPYEHDYYALALAAKRGGWGASFVPSGLRELAKAKVGAAGGGGVTFVQLEGLGKVPFGNVRRPKPLLELALARDAEARAADADADADDVADDADADGAGVHASPLEAHPRVALRLMLEDGLCLLADVDDCERLLAAANSGNNSNAVAADPAALLRRRTLLLEGLAATLRLPMGPEPAKGGVEGGGDAVLRAVASLPKGRRLLAALLAKLPRGGASAARVAWALARSLRHVFAPPRPAPPLPGRAPQQAPAAAEEDASLAALAAAAAGALGGFTPLQLCALLAAVLSGGQLPALDASPPGRAAAAFLTAALSAATAAGLAGASDAGAAPPAVAEATLWQTTFGQFFTALSSRIAAAMGAAAAAAASGDAAATDAARANVPVELLRAAVPHATPAQREHLRRFLALLGA